MSYLNVEHSAVIHKISLYVSIITVDAVIVSQDFCHYPVSLKQLQDLTVEDCSLTHSSKVKRRC